MTDSNHKNSLVPLLLLAGIIISVPLCIHEGSIDSRGSYGPVLYSGPVRADEKTFIETYQQNVLPRDVRLTPLAGDTDAITLRSLHDRRLGLEAVPWDRIVLVADDNRPETRAVIKALGEHFTGQLDDSIPLAVTLQLPSDAEAPPLPLPVWRIIRVGSEDAAEGTYAVPPSPTDSATFAVRIAHLDARSGLLPATMAAGVRESAVRVVWQTDGGERVDDWGRWFATLGRDIASSALTVIEGDGVERAWDRLPDNASTATGSWQGTIPQTPRHEILTWQAAVQEPLLRGWTGAILGKSYRHRSNVKSTIDGLTDLVEGGGWTATSDPDDEDRAWVYDRKDGLQHLRAAKRPYGWELAAWLTHDQPDVVVTGIIDAARGGDAMAKQRLRRLLTSDALDALQRRRAVTALRADPTLPDQAVLGLLPEASGEERTVAQAVAFIRGISDDSPTLSELPNYHPDAEAPALMKIGVTPVVVMPWPHQVETEGGKKETVVDVQVWMRPLDGAPMRRQLQRGEHVAIGDAMLVWTEEGLALAMP